MRAFEWVGFAAGIFIVLATAASLVRALVVPRGLQTRIVSMAARATGVVFFSLARRVDEYERQDRILAFLAPVSLLVLLAVWILLFLLGYALMAWPLAHQSFHHAITLMASSVVTLGVIAPRGSGPTVLAYFAAATGLFVFALQIAYLPTLYGAFNRREALVTTLATRAGSPAWGPEILARHHAIMSRLEALPSFYSAWEEWAADVSESHSNYPVLNWFRSPHPLRNWMLALLAVLDSAAMYNALCPTTAPFECRMCLRMGFTSLREIARALGITFNADPMPTDPISLTFDEYADAARRLVSMGFPVERSIEESWPHFKGWRINYESLAYELLDVIAAPPAMWAGPRTRLPGTPIPIQRPVDRTPSKPR